MNGTPQEHASSYRWVVLLVFMFVALISQLLWLTFAPITSEMAELFHVTANDISLLSLVTKDLKRSGFEAYTHHLVPTNDGGISLGQAVVCHMRCFQCA